MMTYFLVCNPKFTNYFNSWFYIIHMDTFFFNYKEIQDSKGTSLVFGSKSTN